MTSLARRKRLSWDYKGTYGNVHTFLGIKIKYLMNRRVAINIKSYISEAVKEFREDVSLVATSPVTRWLFTVVTVKEL